MSYTVAMDLEAVLAEAREVLPSFFGPSGRPLADLKPTDAAIEQVFVETARAAAKDAYAALWAGAAPLPLPPEGTTPQISVALAEDFASGEPRSKAFANGYRTIADRLVAGVPWFIIRFVKPGATIGLAFDGFVRLGDRQFAWFPKPWKLLAPQHTGGWQHVWTD